MNRLWIVILTLCFAPALLPAQEAKKDDYVERMEVEHATDTPIASPAAQVEPGGEVVSEDVTYAGIDGVDVVGYLAQPASGEAKAGILVIHEWWGLNDNLRSMARQLAGEGYVALAVDLYDVWADKEAGRHFEVWAIPTLIYYDASGQELGRREGFISKTDILAALRSYGIDLKRTGNP
jgi:hypothetical protein